MLDALRRFVDRREQKQPATVYELADPPPELARFAVGVPDWFDPRLADGPFG